MIFNIQTNYPQLNPKEYSEISEENEQESLKSVIKNKQHFGKLETNYNCNILIYNLLNQQNISILELGCGGGEFLASFIRDGHNGLGIDGRPGYTKYVDHAPNWKQYPDNFKSCDIGKPFSILDQYNNIIQFDIITSWECFEHIVTNDIDTLMQNINHHSKIGSYFIGSTSYDDNEDGHRTVEHREFWLEKFKQINFIDTKISLEGKKVRNLHKSDYYILKKEKL